MKAKYQHYGNDCIIYDQVVCDDNIVVTVRSYQGSWCDIEPEVITKVCPTNAEARRLFYNACRQFEKAKDECLYKDVSQN